MESDVVVTAKQDVTIEFIDAAPLTAVVKYDGDNADISLFVRNELHTNSNMAIHGTAKGDEITVDEGDEDTAKIAFAVAEGVNKYLQGTDLLEKYSDTGDDSQGILFKSGRDEEINAAIVEGKKRPALLCTTLFGAPHMTRPYTDEFMNQLMLDGMSHEDMEDAANNGDPSAMKQLAMSYLNGSDEVDEDPEKAYYWFVKLAETGDDQALHNVGLFTAKGFGTERDFGKAAEWMQKAADEGDEDAEAYPTEAIKLDIRKKHEERRKRNKYKESVMMVDIAKEIGEAEGYWLRCEPLRKPGDFLNGSVWCYGKTTQGKWKSCQCFGLSPQGVRPAIRINRKLALSI